MTDQHDQLQRFLFKNYSIRGAIIRMEKSYHAVFERHPYPIPLRKLLGETLAVSALLSAMLKYEGRLTLQTKTEGPLKLLVAQCNHLLEVRGLAQWEGEVNDNSYAQLLGKGQLAVIISAAKGQEYKSIISLDKNDLSKSIEAYFMQSEQLPTAIRLFANEKEIVGILLQAMPDNSIVLEGDFWNTITPVLNKVTEEDIFGSSNAEFLQLFFPEIDAQLYDMQPVKFSCPCSLQRMEQALLSSNREELNAILRTNKYITVTCEFCNRSYDFDANDISKIFSPSNNENSTKH